MAKLEFQFTDRGANATVRAMDRNNKTYNKDVLLFLRKEGKDFLRKLKAERYSGRPGVRVVSGRLRRSLKLRVFRRHNRPTMAIETASPYFNVHEHGAPNLRSSSGKRLAIPLNRAIRSQYKSPLKITHPELIVVTVNGKTYLCDPTGAKPRFTHRLVRSVRIPARTKAVLFMRRQAKEMVRRLGGRSAKHFTQVK